MDMVGREGGEFNNAHNPVGVGLHVASNSYILGGDAPPTPFSILSKHSGKLHEFENAEMQNEQMNYDYPESRREEKGRDAVPKKDKQKEKEGEHGKERGGGAAGGETKDGEMVVTGRIEIEREESREGVTAKGTGGYQRMR